jgi:hypothetical protein
MGLVMDSEEAEPEAQHRACWYGRRTRELPAVPTLETIEDGQLLYCAHPMMFPVVGQAFDIRNCTSCDAFKPRYIRRP